MNMTINSNNVRWWIKAAVIGSILIFILLHFVALSSAPYKAAHKFLSTDDTISKTYGQPLRTILLPYGNSYHIETETDPNGKVFDEHGNAKFVFWVWGSKGHGKVSIAMKETNKTWEKIEIH